MWHVAAILPETRDQRKMKAKALATCEVKGNQTVEAMEGGQRANDVPARALSLELVCLRRGTAEIADGNQRMRRDESAGFVWRTPCRDGTAAGMEAMICAKEAVVVVGTYK